MSNSFKTFLLVIGDIIALYISLIIGLILRYGGGFYIQFEDIHFRPFTVIFVFWIIIFYIAGLYDLHRLRNTIDFIKTLWLAIATSTVLSILMFYAIPFFGIAPKTNLFIFVIVFLAIESAWRRAFNRATSTGIAANRVLLIGANATEEIAKTIEENTQFGYEVRIRMDEEATRKTPEAFAELIKKENINCIVVSRHMKRNGQLPAALYSLFSKGMAIMDLPNFYELVMRKVPIADLEETWFLENIESVGQFYDPLKRAVEFVGAIALGIVLLPFELLIALLVLLTSRGPVIYKQVRVGKNGKEFTLYKFRTMRQDAEKQGVQWATKSDPRATPIGKLLRASHLDELPQLVNIIRGELSFVGPRPERPEWVQKLKTQIPYYETRLLVKPGVTGWAQINHPADTDLEEVKEKLQYDIYYLKNRSLVLDLAIIVKTLKAFFVNPNK
jgi:exopolysaccharide biosynthesis polyprenyl glycosylphosphotransferase